MSDDAWFEVIDGPLLMQGDLLPGCEVLHWRIEDISPDGNIDTSVVATDVVVLTQSCDLENEGKAEFVLLAELVDYDLLIKHDPAKYGKSFRSNCAKGRNVNLALLPPFEGPPRVSWSIINFSRVYTLPFAVVRQHAASLGPRLRLRSPYREHVSQAFGRYFMRVGLPRGVTEFERYEPPQS